jgi:uncharacterized phiE125 gp8 family phage protein
MPTLTESLPGAEPVSLGEAKAQLRVELDGDDALIARLVASARRACEDFTGRALIARSCSLWLDAWPARGWVALPKAPLISVSAINVYDEAGEALALPEDDYYADAASGRAVLKAGVAPPCPGRAVSGVEIAFRAGYGPSAQDVPAALAQGILKMVAHLYARRGEDAGDALRDSGAAGLFAPYRVISL